MSESPEVRIIEAADFEMRSKDGRRIIEGIAVPFDSPALIGTANGSFLEVHRRGSFARTIEQGAKRLPLLVGHQGGLPVGVSENWQESEEGLIGTWSINTTRGAQEAMETVDDGSLGYLSIGFRPVHTTRDRSTDPVTMVRTESALLEVSLVPVPAFKDAALTVRSETVIPPKPTPALDAAREWLEQMRR